MPDPTLTWLFSALRRYVASQGLLPIQNSEEPPLALNKLARNTERFGAEFGSQTNALLHVDDVAVLGEPVNKGGRQVSVLQKGTPFAEAQIGSD